MEWMVTKFESIARLIDESRVITVNEKSFARGLNVYKQMLIFIIGSFLGFALEMIWFIVKYGQVIERKGVFYGPYSPIYGVGMLMLTLLLHRLINKNPLYIMTVSAILGGAFEIICSVAQELVFGTRSWDYSGTFLSIDGRTNFLMMVMWGILGYVFICILYPIINRLIERIPNKFGKIATIVLMICLVVDIGITALAVRRHNERIRGAEPRNRVEEFLDEKYPSEYVDAFLQE